MARLAFFQWPGSKPQADGCDDPEAAIAADREAKQSGILAAVAAENFAAGINEGERFHVVDHRPHLQAAAMGIGGERATERETVRAGLFLADAPDRSGSWLLGMKGFDKLQPFHPGTDFDKSALSIHRADPDELGTIQQQGPLAELLPAHRMAGTAD